MRVQWNGELAPFNLTAYSSGKALRWDTGSLFWGNGFWLGRGNERSDHQYLNRIGTGLSKSCFFRSRPSSVRNLVKHNSVKPRSLYHIQSDYKNTHFSLRWICVVALLSSVAWQRPSILLWHKVACAFLNSQRRSLTCLLIKVRESWFSARKVH